MPETCHRKPAPAATLWSLPDELQLEMFERMERGESYASVREWLVEGGHVAGTSDSALSRFYQKFAARRRAELREDKLAQIIDRFRAKDPGATATELAFIGDAFFTGAALADESNEDFVRVQKLKLEREKFAADADRLQREFALKERALAQKDEALRQSEEKLRLQQFEAARAVMDHLAELRAIAADGGRSAQEKLEGIRQRLFGAAALPAEGGAA